MTRQMLWKVLDKDRKPHLGGSGQWPEPGTWLEVAGEPVPCQNGLHLCRRSDLPSWLGPVIWEAEYEGESIDHDDNLVVRRARLAQRVDTWTERTARLLACDCADRALVRANVTDPKPLKVVRVARLYADGQATFAEMAAARAASRNTVRNAAWYAAWYTAWWYAACDAAQDAAGYAAWDTSWDGAAARAAARYAAGDTSRSVARAAIRAAAGAAERAWQADRLMHHLYPTGRT